MDIVEASNEFHDWELLQPIPLSQSPPAPNCSFPENDIHSGGLVEPNYFSLDAHKPSPGGLDDDKSAASDNPSWIDPGLDDNPSHYLHKDPGGGFWSDSSSEPSQDRKLTDSDGRNEIDLSDNDMKQVRPRGIGEMLEEKVENTAQGLGILPLDSSTHEHDDSGLVNVFAEDSQGEVKNETDKSATGGKISNDAGKKKAADLGNTSVVWWKMPMEILKYCAFKVSPVWAVSVAAAVMGFVILGRKLYKMKKKKTTGLEIKLTVGDKKISQVMSHANRLNDAFSIMKRVPVIRPSLPAVGTTATWPVVSLR